MQREGFRVLAAGTGDASGFDRAALPYHPFRFTRSANPLSDLRSLSALTRIMDEVKPDIVQSFDTKPNILVPVAARRARPTKIVRTVNGMGWLYSSNSPAALALRPAYSVMNRLAARSTAATVFQNSEDKAFFEQHRMIGDSLSRLIPGSGIDIDGFIRPAATDASLVALRRELGLDGCEVVLTVTRLSRQKGIPTLLEAASLVHAIRPSVRFLLVGPREGEGRSAIAPSEIEAHSPYVIATGRRSDVPSLLALADVFAFPTEYREGVPRALLEAALAGLPIVATRMPGCTDVVEDGRTGLLVPPRAPRDLARAVLHLMAEREAGRAMATRASELVRRDFSLARTVARYADLYAELLAAGPGTPSDRRASPHATDALYEAEGVAR
jgi:glycosyltransferase involved in cell wall biosynthesis